MKKVLVLTFLEFTSGSGTRVRSGACRDGHVAVARELKPQISLIEKCFVGKLKSGSGPRYAPAGNVGGYIFFSKTFLP